MKSPIFIARQADSHESLEFPIRANHPIRANRANRFARITPLSEGNWSLERKIPSEGQFAQLSLRGIILPHKIQMFRFVFGCMAFPSILPTPFYAL